MKYEEVEVNSTRWFDLKPLKNEEFRDIKGYEGLYQVSNYGRIKSLKYNDGKHIHKTTLILKQCKIKYNYYVVNLTNKTKRVNIIVAEAFLDKQNFKCMPYENRDTIKLEKIIVNHKDGNKLNNNVDNLEWCTYSYNNKEAYRLGLKEGAFKNKTGKNYPRKVNIIGMYINDVLVEKFYGAGEIKRKYGYHPTAIIDCCRGRYKKMYGYEWRFINE